jgi:surface polysaccharide O-acyltransferase-like enzyme
MLIGIALTALSTYLMMLYGPDQRMYFFQEYLSPTVIFTSIMAFLLLLSVKPPSSSQQIAQPSILSRLFKTISENTLGVYFVHVIVIETIQLGLLGFMLNSEILNPILAVPLLMVITLFISLGIILLLKNIPGLKKIVT